MQVYSDELYHYGVKGMKWGVRKDRQSSGKRRTSKPTLPKNQNDKGLTEVVAATYLAAWSVAALTIAYSVHRNKKEQKYWEDHPEELDKKIEEIVEEDHDRIDDICDFRDYDSLEDVPKLDYYVKPPIMYDVKKINPDYPEDGTTDNCVYCTNTMVLRKKGYELEARHSDDSEGIDTDYFFKKAYPGAKTKRFTKITDIRPRDITNEISKEGEGAYGNISVPWIYGGGHSLYWENVNHKTMIYDTQDGTRVDLEDSNFNWCVDLNNVQYQRLDNVEPSDYALGLSKEVRDDNKERDWSDERYWNW